MPIDAKRAHRRTGAGVSAFGRTCPALAVAAVLILLAPALSAGMETNPAPAPDEAQPASPPLPIAVVSTTMIGSALDDLAADWIRPIVLIPAEGCPGHFDLGPQALADLQRAVLILRHDYQGFLEDGLQAARRPGQRAGVLATSGPQTLPEHYIALCTQLAAILGQMYPERSPELRLRLGDIQDRVKALGMNERGRAGAKIKGMPLLVASFQSEFVDWAGGKVVSTFDRGEEMSLDQMISLIKLAKDERVAGVVGNLQWGDREVQSISQSLKVPGVVLSNYPAAADARGFDKLLRSNVSRLVFLIGDE
jgi:ABC-type Zn uptake system ZnuABC Zn-binding protein ZnuA